jgi:ATP-dependent 26S proteasome regulatory subunit
VEELDSYKFLCRPPEVEVTDAEGKVIKRRVNGMDEGDYLSQNYTNFITLLDGLVPLKNCIFIFTTNHPEMLLQKIYRMGRVNHHIEVNYPREETVLNFLGFNKSETRWQYLQSLEDKRLPLDAIYQIRDAKTVDDIKDIIATRDKTLNLKDQKSYE